MAGIYIHIPFCKTKCHYCDFYKSTDFGAKTDFLGALKQEIAGRKNELQQEDAKKLIANNCMCVAEGANMPCTPDAIHELQSKKVLFAPGKASNAGGVATSGLEMTQNAMKLMWTPKEVDDRLQQIMTDIYESCKEHGKVSDDYIDFVKGANVAGFIKVANAMIDQGIV